MGKQPVVSGELWGAMEALLPRRAEQPKGGRPWVSDRAALGGIIFVLETGIPWKRLPTQLGYGSGTTCWRRHRAEPDRRWETRLQVPPDRGPPRDPAGGPTVGSQPPRLTRLRVADRGDPAHRRSAWAARTATLPTVHLHADKAYDIPRCRGDLRRRGIGIRIARKGVESSERLGRHRWVVERTLAWLTGFRRLATRYERRPDSLTGLLHLACSLIAVRFLTAETGL